MKHRMIKGAAAILCALTLTAAPMQATIGEGLIQEITASAASETALTFNTNGLTNPFEKNNMYYSVSSEIYRTVTWHGVKYESMHYPTIPETVVNPNNGKLYTVTSIGDPDANSLQNRHLRVEIAGLTLPKTIKSINKYAFKNCILSSLSAAEDSQLTMIDIGAFYGNPNLQNVNFGKCKKLNHLRRDCFANCVNLHTIRFANCSTDMVIGDLDPVTTLSHSIFGTNKTNHTRLSFPNTTGTYRDIDLFETDCDYWRDGLISVGIGKGRVWEEIQILRAQNDTSSTAWLSPNNA